MKRKKELVITKQELFFSAEKFHTPIDLLRTGGFLARDEELAPDVASLLERPPDERSGSRMLYLVQFNQIMDPDEPDRLIQEEGLHPAHSFDLIFAGATLFDLDERLPIAALGTKFSLPFFPQMQRCFVLRREGWGRTIIASPLGSSWGPEYRYLAYTPAYR